MSTATDPVPLHRRDGARVQIRGGATTYGGYPFPIGATGTIVGSKRPNTTGYVSVIPDNMAFIWPILLDPKDLTVLEGVPPGRVQE